MFRGLTLAVSNSYTAGVKSRPVRINLALRFPTRSALLSLALGLIALCPLSTSADTIALSFTDQAANLGGSSPDSTLGWAFTLSSPVVVTQLGMWDGPNQAINPNAFVGDGLLQQELVTIWTGTGTQVAQATLSAGTAATLNNGFRYVPITPLQLAAGNYTIGVFDRDGLFFDYNAVEAATVSTASGITYLGSRSAIGNVFPFGDQLQTENAYFGPNFQFTPSTNGNGNGVPETGSSMALMLAAIGTIGALRRKIASGVFGEKR
jgi:hypothetical protein